MALSGMKLNIIREAVILRVRDMDENLEEVISSYTKLDEEEKQYLRDQVTSILGLDE